MEQADGLKQYGISKENRPNPIVQMGLFIDGDGIPLAFSITKGNTNEQITLQPLEKKILSDFHLSKFIVCTDAGLSSTANRKFNDKGERSFITTQSVKQLKGHLKTWALSPSGWKDADKEERNPKTGKITTYNIASIQDFDEGQEEHLSDGFYAVCTNLEDSVSEIVKINKGRWEIEESFRIMKSEFKSRPVYLSRDDRIEAHFTTCFMSLLLYRLLEKTLNKEFDKNKVKKPIEPYTCNEIIRTLKEMNLYKVNHEGYIPLYQRTELTDILHDTFGFRTDYEILSNKKLKKIFKETKK